MLFNSVVFLLFFPLFFIGYWFLTKKNLTLQNIWILLSSYVFYGWWDYRFLSLLVFSTVLDFYAAKNIENSENEKVRKLWLTISMVGNLGLLGFFKYFNFFVKSFVEAFASIGYDIPSTTLEIILPVGISFYTFQTMSYTIDVYRRVMPATNNILNFGAYVTFFPQLVAGPIERASHLLPQIEKPRFFSYEQARDGARLILWGMFKKVIIADSLAPVVDDIFRNYTTFSGGTLVLGAVFFAIQIYGDFSGYSDIAIGLSKIFGFELMSNFRFPYFSRDIPEFWRRWHISLSTWFRDYLYIPLGGSRTTKPKAIRNVFAIFLVSGFWHGANWTFLIWGGIHSLLFLPSFLMGTNRKHTSATVAEGKMFPSLKELGQMLLTFATACVAWVFFRAASVGDAVGYLMAIPKGITQFGYKAELIYVILILGADWVLRHNERKVLNFKLMPVRWACYLIISVIVLLRIVHATEQNFIYFQF